MRIQCEVNTNSAHRLLPITGIKVKHKVTTWSVKSTLLHLGGCQHTSFHLSYFKFHTNALVVFSPEFPYEMKEITWNLLTEACAMQRQKTCILSQRATSFTHTQSPLTDQYDRKPTLQRNQVQHAVWNTHVRKQPWRLTFSTWQSHFITEHLKHI